MAQECLLPPSNPGRRQEGANGGLSMKRIRALVLFFAIFFLFWAAATWAIHSARAQMRQPIEPFDLVILLDVSGSLPKTDPNSLGLQVARFAIEYLQLALDEHTDSRIAVVPFAADADDTVKLQKILNVKWELLPQPETFRGGTHFVRALNAAATILKQQSTPERRRIVLLITDGEPDPPSTVAARWEHLRSSVAPVISQHAILFDLYVVGAGTNEYEDFWDEYLYWAVKDARGLSHVYEAMAELVGLSVDSHRTMRTGEVTVDLTGKRLVAFFAEGVSREVTGTVTLTNRRTGESEQIPLGGREPFYLLRALEGRWEIRFSGGKGEVFCGGMLLPPVETPTPSPTPMPTSTPTLFPAPTAIPTLPITQVTELLQIGDPVLSPARPRSGQPVHLYVPVTAAITLTNLTVVAQVSDGMQVITTVVLSPQAGGFGGELGALTCPPGQLVSYRYTVLITAQARLPEGQLLTSQRTSSLSVSSSWWMGLRRNWLYLLLLGAICYAVSKRHNIARYKPLLQFRITLCYAEILAKYLHWLEAGPEERERIRRRTINRIGLWVGRLLERRMEKEPSQLVGELTRNIDTLSKLFVRLGEEQAREFVHQKKSDPLIMAVNVIRDLDLYRVEPRPEGVLTETMKTIVSIAEYGGIYEPVAAIALVNVLRAMPKYETYILDTLFTVYDLSYTVLYWTQWA